MLEYLFTSQKRARLPTDKTRLPVAPDTASTAGDFPCSAQCNSRPALQPGSPRQAEVKHTKVQHQTLQDLTFWHSDSLEQVKILALTYVRLTQVCMGSSGWHGQEPGVLQKCWRVLCLSKDAGLLIQCTDVTYTAEGSQLALIWPAQTTGRTQMSASTCLQRHPLFCMAHREPPRLSQTSQGKMDSLGLKRVWVIPCQSTSSSASSVLDHTCSFVFNTQDRLFPENTVRIQCFLSPYTAFNLYSCDYRLHVRGKRALFCQSLLTQLLAFSITV